LGSDENERNFLHVSELRHFCVIVVDRVEARLVLKAEHEDDRVHPGSELKIEEFKLKIKLF
jgi:hypothetical protein